MGVIERFVRSKYPWIVKHKQLARAIYLSPAHKTYVAGEEFLYLGKHYKLALSNTAESALSFTGVEFILNRKYLSESGERFIKWYRWQALKTLEQRLEYYSVLAGLKPSEIKISNAKKRWGSCNSKGVINFSWRIIMAPMNIVDYVVVHELMHIAERNHSKKFWDKVGIYFPQYKQAKLWLGANQHKLVL